jgi:hypothetical protein
MTQIKLLKSQGPQSRLPFGPIEPMAVGPREDTTL